jgi:hypothetical protein
MTRETPSADTILAVNFGAATTRALLFDVVENVYRFVGCGESPSTVDAPYSDASEGLRLALGELEAVTGRAMLDDSARLVMPATTDGRGADAFVATSSAGPAVRTLLVGLLPDVSLDSARRITTGSYLKVLDRFSLGDTRGQDEQIDAVIAANPELLVIAGGTDGGATDALLKLVETVGLACHLLPPGTKTRALFAGNADLQARMTGLLSRVAGVRTAPNVQPDLAQMQLAPARVELGNLVEELRGEQIGGFLALSQWAGGRILPTAEAAGQYVRFLSKLPAWPRGVLSVDVGSANTSVAAAWNGELHLSTRPDLGLGANAAQVLAEPSSDLARRWLPFACGEEAWREFVLNKSAHPASVPADLDDLWLELALARQVLRAALVTARADWPANAPSPRPELLPWFSLILGGGAVLARAPRPGLAALVLLDALQPAGVTRLMIDGYHLAPALGGMAATHPAAVAQVYDSLAFLDLGTAVSLVGRGTVGQAAIHIKLAEDDGPEREVDVPFGSVEVLPLPLGRKAKLTLRPRAGFNAGWGAGRGRSIRIQGGVLGVIIDARGRPIVFPRAPEQAQLLVKQWMFKVSGIQ